MAKPSTSPAASPRLETGMPQTQSHCLLLVTLAPTLSGQFPSTLLLEAVSVTSISRRLKMEVWFGRVTLTAVILLTATVLVLLHKMIVGDKWLLLICSGQEAFLVCSGR
jgi:hypothetical protein